MNFMTPLCMSFLIEKNLLIDTFYREAICEFEKEIKRMEFLGLGQKSIIRQQSDIFIFILYLIFG